jgi:hypothetical protein
LADDDRAWFGGITGGGEREPVTPGVLDRGGRVTGGALRGELRAEPGRLGVGTGAGAGALAGGRVHVTGVGEHVRAGLEIVKSGTLAIPAQQQDRRPFAADQDEWVVAGEGFRVVMQVLEGRLPVGRRTQREFAAGSAAVGRGGLAAAVQDGAEPGQFGVDREPGAACLLIPAADQR